MDGVAALLVTLGGLLLVGLATDALGRRTALPRVTLLLLFGLLIGPAGLDLLPGTHEQWFPIVANMALVMVGFLLGETLSPARLRKQGRVVFVSSILVVVTTAACVTAGLLLLGVPMVVALLLGGIAAATDPATTTDVVHEAEARGDFTDALLGIVAIDDAWGLIAFSLLLAAAEALSGHAGGAALALAARDLGGAVLLGAALGVPMALLSGRLRPGEPTLAEALGFVFLCGGLALWLEISFLLAAMVLGAVVANVARHHTRPFHAIEGIEWPFMILFFVFAGAAVDLHTATSIGVLGAAYVLLRIAGRIAGGWLGGRLAGAGPAVRRWMGVALMPQAGVALGMALVASERFPRQATAIMPVVVGATVLFELVGPLLTRLALVRAGEAGAAAASDDRRPFGGSPTPTDEA